MTDALSGINLLDLDRFEQGVPDEWFTALRREAPVYRHLTSDGDDFWVLTKHSDIQAVTRDWATFSSAPENGGIMGLTRAERAIVTDSAPKNYLPLMDPPAHTKYRRVVAATMMPGIISALEPKLREICQPKLDAATGGGAFEFVNSLAANIPLEAIAELGNIPMREREQMFYWANALSLPNDPEYNPTPESYFEARRGLMEYCNELYDRRKKEPGDDLISVMIRGEIDGIPTTREQSTSFFDILLAAGSETTRNALSHGVLAFAQHPDQYDMARQRPELIGQGAVEEILRWATPIMHFRRGATKDTEIRGHQIRQGDGVAMFYISANRDEEVFEAPFEFNITRSPNPHLTFGGGGPHNCLGAMFARLEMRVFFEELAKRASSVRVVGEITRVRSNTINGIKKMAVELVAA